MDTVKVGILFLFSVHGMAFIVQDFFCRDYGLSGEEPSLSLGALFCPSLTALYPCLQAMEDHCTVSSFVPTVSRLIIGMCACM